LPRQKAVPDLDAIRPHYLKSDLKIMDNPIQKNATTQLEKEGNWNGTPRRRNNTTMENKIKIG
jgi:hypothetical protein